MKELSKNKLKQINGGTPLVLLFVVVAAVVCEIVASKLVKLEGVRVNEVPKKKSDDNLA